MGETGSMQADFSVVYKWREGTLPPPHYYEYVISAGPGAQGRIDFRPDYPNENPPVWTEAFPLDAEALEKLYALMIDRDVFGRSWTEIEDGPVGSRLEWMEVTAGGRKHLVPSVIEEAKVVEDIYAAISALVPEKIWTGLMARREEFVRSYGERQG